ncbi:CDP-diacylglycerol--serine O-phosphatidyltransferase [Sphingomonas psychrotolerans]|uniref:CDP-diacylglycerol--serine O-phosphatidyltransferase n=1 Tax=Sphingomonas psychrotolerans TaxID=1327635 RepID=A0ABU3N0K6_9SPHN|nr:CDP-diacylglycerol--serine O-phosphatidyltransferase [Sphingomonas psychrotolerans]MDT8758082.1 CDP-diacylglycerol--serine O-phosphatidyltransferase [Sphingomonas psychrotolerans]
MRPPRAGRRPLPGLRRDGGIPLRAVLPNTVTALALCSGLTAIRFAILGNWEVAVLMVLAAAVFDGLDGKIARLVRAESRFGAELDSLSDAISFGVAPALILYLWSLNSLGRFGWMIALLLALFCALRLARFNARIDREDQPHKSAGFLTGVPAPAGAMLALTPVFLWNWTGELLSPSGNGLANVQLAETLNHLLRSPAVIAIWTAFIAVLMISSIATFAPTVRLKQRLRFEAIAVLVVLVAALVSAPWPTLALLSVVYLASIPFSVRSYRRVMRQRAAAHGPAAAPERREP